MLKQDMSTCAAHLAIPLMAIHLTYTFSYLVGQLSEAEGSLDGCSKTCSRQAEYVSKLTFEIEETDKKLVLEAERLQRREWDGFVCSGLLFTRFCQVERRMRST